MVWFTKSRNRLNVIPLFCKYEHVDSTFSFHTTCRAGYTYLPILTEFSTGYGVVCVDQSLI